MSQVLEDSDEELLPRPSPVLLDGRPVRAPIVVVLHENRAALWLVDLVGELCGAWLLPTGRADQARRVLTICSGRSLIAVDPSEPVEHVLNLAKIAGIDVARLTLESHVCGIGELLHETARVRADCAEVLRNMERQERKKFAPLVWKRPLPDPLLTGLEDLSAAAGIRRRGGAGTEKALQTASLARWAIRLWADTETTRSRRRCLRDAFGPTQPLPSSWRKAMIRA